MNKKHSMRNVLYSLMRPFLLRWGVSDITLLLCRMLRWSNKWPLSYPQLAQPGVCQHMGLSFANPVGLAAGFDTNGDFIDELAELGFGFLEVGTVTPLPQESSVQPRMVYFAHQKSLLYRTVLPNLGVQYLVKRLQASLYLQQGGTVGVSIGKNDHTPVHHMRQDFEACFIKVHDYASYVALDLSFLATVPLSEFDRLYSLLQAIKRLQMQLAHQRKRYVPIVLKISPDMSIEQVTYVSNFCLDLYIDGIISGHGSVRRVVDPFVQFFPDQPGRVSGASVQEFSRTMLRQVVEKTSPSKICLINSGGLLSAQDVSTSIQLGADLVQLYTGLIDQGPRLIEESLTAIFQLEQLVS